MRFARAVYILRRPAPGFWGRMREGLRVVSADDDWPRLRSGRTMPSRHEYGEDAAGYDSVSDCRYDRDSPQPNSRFLAAHFTRAPKRMAHDSKYSAPNAILGLGAAR